MTTLDSLDLAQVTALAEESATFGDSLMYADCDRLIDGYTASDCSELSAFIDESRGEIREAARRIVSAIQENENQS